MEAACLRYLAGREHSREELRQKLRLANYAPHLVEAVIADFGERGLQSDDRFAEVFSRSRRNRGYGPYRIRQDLRQRGICAEEATCGADQDWDALLELTYGRKFGDLPPQTPEERARRERFLLRRGFSGDQIRRLFHRLRETVGEK